MVGAPLRSVANEARRLVFALESATVGQVVGRLSGLADLRDIAIVQPDIEDVVTRLYASTAPADPPAASRP